MSLFFQKIFLIAVVFVIACNNRKAIVEIVEKDEFIIKLPSNCYWEKVANFDSEFGEIKCENLLLSYDYGYCIYSNHATYSPQDYLNQNKWLIEAIPKILPKNKEVSMDTIFNEIKVLSLDEDQLTAKFEYKGKVYEHNIEIPIYLKNLVEKKDTTEGVITRIIYNKERPKEIDCYKINTLKYNKNNSCTENLIIRIKSEKPLDTLNAFNLLNNIDFPR